MEKHRHGHEDHEPLMFHFHSSYPCAYYVQCPSTVSHANSATDAAEADIRTNTNINTHFELDQIQSTFQFLYSPTRSEPNFLNDNKNPDPDPEADVSGFTLSRYSSSRGSNNSFLHLQQQQQQQHERIHHHKKIVGGADTDQIDIGVNRLIINDRTVRGVHDGEDDDDNNYIEHGKKIGWWWWWRRYCSFRKSNSCSWISLQICWRLVLSFAVALLVFYLATKPPPPNISIKMGGVGEFVLGEGVDASGVTTKILICNCYIHLLIDNKSKVFGLHVHPPIMDIYFGRLPFAMSHSMDSSKYELYVGTRNKPMYGAGRIMEDLLESGMGLPLLIHVKLTSNFRVVWNLINPTFHHQAQCFLILLNDHNNHPHPHPSQLLYYNSTCTTITAITS